MTALCVFKQEDVVSIVVDGAAYDAFGTVLFATTKAFALPHINAIISLRCNSSFAIPALAHLLGTAASYDDLRAGITMVMPEMMDVVNVMAASYKQPPLDKIEVFVGGFTGSGEADAYMAADSDGVWTVSPIADLATSPASPEIHRDTREVRDRGIAHMDPRKDGLAILKAQRNYPIGRVYGVGCHVQMMQIHRDGRIETGIIYCWPKDKKGHPIEPHGPPADFGRP